MRLLIWCSTFSYGGGERLLKRLVEALLLNPDIQTLGLAIPEAARQSFAKLATKHQHLHLLYLPRLRYRQWTTFAAMPRLRDRLDHHSRLRRQNQLQRAFNKWSNDFDVLYCFWAQSEPFLKSELPVIATIQDLTALEFPETLGEKQTADIRADTLNWLRHASHVVVSSSAMKEKLLRLFPETKCHIIVIHHAASPVENGNESPVTDRIQLPERYLIYPANLNTHKNHYNLLIAFERWSQRGAIPLVLVGEGTQFLDTKGRTDFQSWQTTRLKALIVRKGLRPGIDFFPLGYVSDLELAGLIKGAWALVMPSLAEGGGSFPVEEALSFGVPVACSNIPVMSEHLSMRSAKVAWFDPECPGSVVRALDELFTGYASFKELALAGRSDPRPTWKEITAAYVKVFKETLTEK